MHVSLADPEASDGQQEDRDQMGGHRRGAHGHLHAVHGVRRLTRSCMRETSDQAGVLGLEVLTGHGCRRSSRAGSAPARGTRTCDAHPAQHQLPHAADHHRIGGHAASGNGDRRIGHQRLPGECGLASPMRRLRRDPAPSPTLPPRPGTSKSPRSPQAKTTTSRTIRSSAAMRFRCCERRSPARTTSASSTMRWRRTLRTRSSSAGVRPISASGRRSSTRECARLRCCPPGPDPVVACIVARSTGRCLPSVRRMGEVSPASDRARAGLPGDPPSPAAQTTRMSTRWRSVATSPRSRV